MKLYGNTMSPFVRRIRVIAAEVGEPVELVSMRPEDPASGLADVSPIRKVPAALFGERMIYDSQRIAEWLILTRGWGNLVAPKDHWNELNLINALDEALLSVVQVFYLRRDGVPGVEGSAFEKRQWERADSIFNWARPQLREDKFGIPEISAVCALDWFEFRPQHQKYATERAGIDHIRKAWRERWKPSMPMMT
jgi:glutathione S-transferase